MSGKSLFVCGCAVSLAAGALGGPVFSGTTSLSASYGAFDGGGGGGEMLASTASLHFTAISLGEVPDRFETFCMERHEAVGGATHRADRNDRTVADPTNPLYQGGLHGGQQDPLSDGTAWLYSRFITGTLAGYRYGGTWAERAADAEAVQAAIWALEEDMAAPGAGTNPFYDAALGAVSGGYANDGSVQVLNLYTLFNMGGNIVRDDYQDVVVMVPGPGVLMIGAVGAAGVVGRRRR